MRTGWARPSMVAVWVTALFGPGCAGPGGLSVQQTVTVETPGCAVASCELGNDQGLWRLPSTPGAVTVTTSRAPLRVSCRAEQGQQAQVGARSTVAPAGAAGAVTGGVVGGVATGVALGATALAFIPPLGLIAVLSGAAAGAAAGQAVEAGRQAIRYPERIEVLMSCTVAGLPAAPEHSFGMTVRGLSPAEALAAGAGDRGAVLVGEVVAGSAAEAAGLRAGDIVLEAGGRPVADAALLERIVRGLAPRQSLLLRMLRQGQGIDLMLVRRDDAP